MKEKITEIAHEKNVDILYITEYGSKLYGTNSESSDTDYKVIFLPKLKDVLICNFQNSFSISTGTNNSKNSNEDIDIEFYSLQYWMNNVKKGETGALDILFSIFRKDTQLYIDENFETEIKSNYKNYFTATEAEAYIRYALAQMNTYSIKGERLKILEDINNYLNNLNETLYEQRINDIFNELKHFLDNEYCHIDSKHITILGKKHDLNIFVFEFKDRINNLYKKYGHRAQKAKECNGFDFKAVSHALRTIFEMEELLTTEFVHFPLKSANKIKQVKYGEIKKEEALQYINDKINQVSLILKDKKINNDNQIKYNKDIANQLIFNMYRRKYVCEI